MSDKEAAYNAALVEFQKDLPHVGKDSRADIETKGGGKFGYSYADLTAITEAALPLLTAHGLAFSAKPTLNDAGTFVLRYELKHEQGHSDGGDFPLTQGTMQQIGSAITYARRYAFCAVTGIAPGGEDDDGAKASEARGRSDSEISVGTLRGQIANVGGQMGWDRPRIEADFTEWTQGRFIADCEDVPTLTGYLGYLNEERKKGLREHKQLVADVNQTTQAGVTRQDSTDRGRVERGAVPTDEDAWAVPPEHTRENTGADPVAADA